MNGRNESEIKNKQNVFTLFDSNAIIAIGG